MSTVTTHAWLQVQAKYSPNGQAVTGARVTRMTVNYPTVTDPDVRLIRVNLTLPVEAWDEIVARVDVPLEAIETPEIVAEVEDQE